MNKYRRYNILVETMMKVLKPVCEGRDIARAVLDDRTKAYVYPSLPHKPTSDKNECRLG